MIYNIEFRKNSQFAILQEKIYSKRKIYELLIQSKKKNKIKYTKCKEQRDSMVFCYSLKKKGHIIRMRITMDKNDPYFHKFEKLEEMIPNRTVFRTTFSLFVGAIVMLKNPIVAGEEITKEIVQPLLEEKLEPEDDNVSFDELFACSTLDSDFVLTYVNEDWLQNEGAFHLSIIKPYVSILKVSDSVEETMEVIANQTIEHKTDLSTLYDEEKNNFYFDTMLNYIKNQSEIILPKQDIISYPLTDEEWTGVIEQLYDFVEYSKKENPYFDVENFICKLTEVTIYKNVSPTIGNESTYGSYGDYDIVFHTFQNEESNNQYFDTQAWERIINHEYVHLIEDWCPCEKQKTYGVDGVSIDVAPIVNQKYQFLSFLQPYEYTFLNEWSAEKYASVLDDGEIATYFCENYVAQSLEYALSINPDYKIGNILKDNVGRNPIAFYQEFPYLYDSKEELTDYVEMLACYDYSFSNGTTLLGDATTFYDELEPISTEDLTDDLHYYAQVQHISLFYKNLYLLNESTEEDLSEYSNFLIHLFNAIMRKQEEECFQNRNIDLENILLQGYINFYQNYLSLKYPDMLYDMSNDDSSLKSFTNFPSFIESEKIEYYTQLIQELDYTIYENKGVLIKK